MGTQGIDDMCLKYFVEAGCMAIRRVEKSDMKIIARATGATMCMTLANMEGEETFDASMLGECEAVRQDRVCDDEFLVFEKPKAKSSASIILRGANDFMLTKWSGRCTTPSALSSVCWNRRRRSRAAARAKQRSRSTSRTLQHSSAPENSSRLLSLPVHCWSSQRRSRSTLRSTQRTWWQSSGQCTTPRRRSQSARN